MARGYFAAIEHGRCGCAQRFAIDGAQAGAAARFGRKDVPFAGLYGWPPGLVVAGAMAAVGTGHVRVVVFAVQAQGEIVWRQADQYRAGGFFRRIETTSSLS